jgi:hypothetical protein
MQRQKRGNAEAWFLPRIRWSLFLGLEWQGMEWEEEQQKDGVVE